MWSQPAFAQASREGAQGGIIRCASKIFLVCGRIALMTSGPYEMLGTKCPSMTSRWIQSAPAASTARTSSPSLEKSEARIEGAIARGRGAKAWVMAVSRGGRERWTRPNMGLSAGQCRGGVLPVGGNFCRDRHELPVFPAVQSAVKADFIELFALARRLLTSPEQNIGRGMPHRLELCNVVRSWGRIERARRDPVADEFEIVLVDAEDGVLAKACDQSVRDRQWQQQHDRRDLVGQCGQNPADLAGDDERAVRPAEPILGHYEQRSEFDLVQFNILVLHAPRRRPEGSVLADRWRRRRQDHQVGIRECARRRRHQPRAGRRRFLEAGFEYRRQRQPR